MPRGDRTGPSGAGPMSGRGAGWCGGNDRPGFATAAPRLGLGLGHRGGGRRGWRNMYYTTGRPGWDWPGIVPPVQAAEQELADLQARATSIAEQLGTIQKRIDDIEGRRSTPAE